MLVLTRKKNEKILIGNDITVEVLEVKGNRVKLGITAPDGYRIVRAELEEEEAGDDTQPGSEERG